VEPFFLQFAGKDHSEIRSFNLLHEADDDAVIWLEATATAALTK